MPEAEIKTILPILWWAVFRRDAQGNLPTETNDVFAYWPAADKDEATHKVALRYEVDRHQLIAVEAYGETCARCHQGFLMVDDRRIYTHAYCPKCWDKRDEPY